MKEVYGASPRMTEYVVRTQFNHRIDECEALTGTPSLADPNAEVYTVAQLIARHEKGLLTNLNIGKDTAYPEFARLNDIDLEKAMNLEPTDRIHLANEMENDPEYVRIRKEEHERKQKETDDAKLKEFQDWAQKNGWKSPDQLFKESEKGGVTTT